VKGLNWTIILYNIREAREQLEEIEARVKTGEKVDEIEFQIMIEHAYHHLNFAWNVRHASTRKYANLTDEDFDLWSKFPKEIKASRIGGRKREAKKPKKKAETSAASRRRA